MAIRDLYPGQRVRFRFSAGHGGVLLALPGIRPDAAAIEQEMRRLAAADLPFTRTVSSTRAAIRYFEEDGQKDKAALLRHRPKATLKLYECGGMKEYFYGAMAPSTGFTSVFALTPYGDDGLVLMPPSPAHPDTPTAYVDRPKHMRAFVESDRWCDILGVQNVTDLTEMIEEGRLRTFIRVNEVLHDNALSEIASDIVAKGRRVVLIAGPSSSGKTTTAGRLGIHLRVLGKLPVQVSMDNYYLDRDTIPPQEDGTVDLENINALDLPLLQAQIRALLRGEAVSLPVFNFNTGKREAEGIPLTLPEGGILIIEGIHGLNPLLSDELPQDAVYRLFVSALTCLNLDDHNRIRTTDVRLLRRIVRDFSFRGTLPADTLAMWNSVRRGEETWIFPFQEQADAVFNTALHYELPFLKQRAYALLAGIPETDPLGLPAGRLLKILNYVPAIPEELFDEVPPVSILREFIGGSGFDRG